MIEASIGMAAIFIHTAGALLAKCGKLAGEQNEKAGTYCLNASCKVFIHGVVALNLFSRQHDRRLFCGANLFKKTPDGIVLIDGNGSGLLHELAGKQ